MPVDAEQWRAEIGNFNGCLHYAVIKLKLNLFHVMTNVSQFLVFLLAILLQCISKGNTASCFLTYFVFIMSPVVLELTPHAVCASNSDISLHRFLLCIISKSVINLFSEKSLQQINF